MENEEKGNESASDESKDVRDVQEAVDSQTEDLKSLEVPTEGITLSQQKTNTDLPEVTESDLKGTKEEIPNKAEEPEGVQNSMEVPIPAEEEEKTVIPPDQAEKSQKREQDESKNIPEKEPPSLKSSKERKAGKSKANPGTSSSEYIPGHYFKLELIRIVKNYPCIYNKNHDHFKDLQAKKAAWRKISNKLSIKMKICIVTFRDLLERFSAIYESSEASQSPKDVPQGDDFPYYKEMLYIMEETVQEEADVNEKRVGKKRKKEKKKKSAEENKNQRIEGATSCPDKELAGSSKEQPQERGTEAPPAAADAEEGDDDDVILIDPVVDSIEISSDEESGNLPVNENKKENPTDPPQKSPNFDINVSLIRAVKSHPCLYDPKNGYYLNHTVRMHTWYRIARQMKALPDDCQQRFLWLYRNFLDYFIMENIHSQIPIDPARKFPYYEEMLFVTASLDVPPSLGSPGYLCTQQEEFILRESIWRSIKVFTGNSVPLRSDVNAFQARHNQQRGRLPNKKNQRVRHPSPAEVPAKRFKKNPVLQQPRLVAQNSQAKVQEGETEKMDVDAPEDGTSVSENSAQVEIPNVDEGGGNAKEPQMETKDDPDEISLENTHQTENPDDGDSSQDKDQATEEGNQTNEDPKIPIDGAKDSEEEASDGAEKVQSLDENSKEEDKAEDPANKDENDQKTNHPEREPSDNFNVQLIRAVKSNPCLYDIQNSFYLNPFFADRIWDEIAQELRTTRHFCKKTYSWLFGKFKDNFLETLQGKQSEQFVYYNEMIFLMPYIIQNHLRKGQQQEGGRLGNEDGRFSGETPHLQQSSAGNNAPRWKPIWPGNTTFASIRSLAQNSQASQNETTTNTAGNTEIGAKGKRDEEKMSSSTATSTSQPNESDQSIQDAESSPSDTEKATKQGEMNENQESGESQGKENVEEAQENAENSPERLLQDHASIELFFKSIMQQVKRSNLTEKDFIDLQLAVINALATTLNNSSKN